MSPAKKAAKKTGKASPKRPANRKPEKPAAPPPPPPPPEPPVQPPDQTLPVIQDDSPDRDVVTDHAGRPETHDNFGDNDDGTENE